MACPPSPLDFPLHSHFGVLAQRRRGIFRDAHKAAAETRRVPIRRRSPSRHQSLPRRAQPAIEAFHMDRKSRQNHRSCQTRAPSVRFDPLAHRQTRRSLALGCPQQRSHPDTRAASDRLCPVVGELKHAARLIYLGGCRLLFGSKKPHSGGFVGHPKCYPVSAAPLSAAYRYLQKPKVSLSSYDRNGRARQSRMRPAHHAGSLQESNHDRHSTGNSVPDHRPRGKER